MRFAPRLCQVEPLDLKRFKRVEVNALHQQKAVLTVNRPKAR